MQPSTFDGQGHSLHSILWEIPVFSESSLVYHVRLGFSGSPYADATRRERIGWRLHREIWLWFLLGLRAAF